MTRRGIINIMPTYTFQECQVCYPETPNDTNEFNVSIAERDSVYCSLCCKLLVRKIDRPASVWAPSSSTGTMRTR